MKKARGKSIKFLKTPSAQKTLDWLYAGDFQGSMCSESSMNVKCTCNVLSKLLQTKSEDNKPMVKSSSQSCYD